MVNIPESIQKVIEDYISRISSQIPVEKAYLFGSYAKNTFDDGSDIDIAIFSNYFTSMDGVSAFKFLIKQTRDYDYDLEPLPFTVADYEDPLGIVEEILKTGIELPINRVS